MASSCGADRVGLSLGQGKNANNLGFRLSFWKTKERIYRHMDRCIVPPAKAEEFKNSAPEGAESVANLLLFGGRREPQNPGKTDKKCLSPKSS